MHHLFTTHSGKLDSNETQTIDENEPLPSNVIINKHPSPPRQEQEQDQLPISDQTSQQQQHEQEQEQPHNSIQQPQQQQVHPNHGLDK